MKKDALEISVRSLGAAAGRCEKELEELRIFLAAARASRHHPDIIKINVGLARSRAQNILTHLRALDLLIERHNEIVEELRTQCCPDGPGDTTEQQGKNMTREDVIKRMRQAMEGLAAAEDGNRSLMVEECCRRVTAWSRVAQLMLSEQMADKSQKALDLQMKSLAELNKDLE